jgi:ESCRT-II complex subunit VPS22
LAFLGLNWVARKSIWTDLGFGNFYNKLAIQLLTICNRSKAENGGLMRISEMIKIYHQTQDQKITKSDVLRAIGTLKELGTGCEIVDKDYISIVPVALNLDSITLLNVAEKKGKVSLRIMKQEQGWEEARFDKIIKKMAQEGLAWVDKQTDTGEWDYYFPAASLHL